jgi:hypothetical protein
MISSALSAASIRCMGAPSYGVRVEELAFSMGCGLPAIAQWASHG